MSDLPIFGAKKSIRSFKGQFRLPHKILLGTIAMFFTNNIISNF